MNRAKVHRPVALDLGADPRDERLVLADGVEVGRRVAAQAGRQRPSRGRRAGPPSDEPDARPDERVPAEQDGIGASRGGARELAQPRVGDPRPGAAGPRRSGPPRAARPRSSAPEPVGEEDPAVDDGARRRAARDASPSERRAVAVEQRAEDGGRRPLAGGRARPQPALLDERPRPRRGRAARARPSVAAEVRPATSSSARRIGRDGADAGDPVRGRGPGRRRASAGRELVARRRARTRSSGPSMSTPSRQRRRRSATVVAGDLGQPARQGVVAGRSGQVARAPRPRRDGDDVGRVAVVGERPPVRRTRGRATRSRRSRGRRERDRAGAEDDQPVRPLGADELAEPRARTVYRRAAR